MEVSIKRRAEHITRLETIVREEFDDASMTGFSASG